MAYDRDPAGQTHRGAFFRCFLASFLLVLVAAGACVYFNAVDRQLFETALLENVDYVALGMDADSMRSFAKETILFLTDAAFDKLLVELQQIEATYPDLVTPDSYTQRVGGFVSEQFAPVTHMARMYSMDDAMNLDELDEWLNRTEEALGAGRAP